jgi:hypothetical protein
MVKIDITKRSFTRTYDRFSKFILIGHKIDGRLNFQFQEFSCYEYAMLEIPKIFNDLHFAGEWDMQFYQVPNNYKLKKLWGYYEVPVKGKLIFEFSYMMASDSIEVTMNHNFIHFSCISRDYTEIWDESDDDDEDEPSDKYGLDEFDVSETYTTIFLKEPKKYHIQWNIFRGKFVYLEDFWATHVY